MRNLHGSMALLVWTISCFVTTTAMAATLQVGPGKTYATVAAAVAAAKGGDVVEIAAGDYVDDTFNISINLTLRGTGASRPHLKATKAIGNKKGIMVIGGSARVVVENLEFSGAQVVDQNGAGIRMQGAALEVRNCYFHDNENGILSGGNSHTILIEHSEFAANGRQGSGYQHNLYIGSDCQKLTFRYSTSHHAKSGHNLKSRAQENHILYSRLMDEGTGTASYTIDLPQGGRSYLIGNLLQQGPQAENTGTMISYKGESPTNPLLELFVINNTFVNEVNKSTNFVRATAATKVWLYNNLFVGQGTPLSLGAGTTGAEVKQEGNLQPTTAVLVDRANYDYHLLAGSAPIDAGKAPGSVNGVALTPTQHYVHPAQNAARPVLGTLDVGAYEFGQGPPAPDAGSLDSATPSRDGAVARDATGLDTPVGLDPVSDETWPTRDGWGGERPNGSDSDAGCCALAGAPPPLTDLLALLLGALWVLRRRR